jgi:hypothetical protein
MHRRSSKMLGTFSYALILLISLAEWFYLEMYWVVDSEVLEVWRTHGPWLIIVMLLSQASPCVMHSSPLVLSSHSSLPPLPSYITSSQSKLTR